MGKHRQLKEKILLFTLTISMVTTMISANVLAKENIQENQEIPECHLLHDEQCGYNENIKDSVCTHSCDQCNPTNNNQQSKTVRSTTVNDLASLKAAITNSVGTLENPAEIEIDVASIIVDSVIDISAKHVKLTGGQLLRNANYFGNIFELSDSSLKLANITIDGNNVESSKFLIQVTASTLIMEEGAVLQNNKNSAVKLKGVSTFTMNNGIIQNNKATSGGAVQFTNSDEAKFVMNNGIIQDNSATDNGSAISEVGATIAPTIEINGGEIKNNTIVNGTDVFGTIQSNGTLIMKGGTISNNSTSGRGGGVYKQAGIFTMTGGTIKENTDRGGDTKSGNNVYLYNATLKLGGSASIPDGLFINKNATVKITSKLTGNIGIQELYDSAVFGDLIATGDDYTLTQEDVDKFTYKADRFVFAFDTINNQIKLAKSPGYPSADVDNRSIYANGTPIILQRGSDEINYTVIYIDKNKNGAIDATDVIWAPDGMDRTEKGNSLGDYSIYGASIDEDLSTSSKIFMLGGKLKSLYGGAPDKKITGDTNITISGGTISNLYGGSSTGSIIGNTNVTISGGTISTTVFGGSYNGSITGNTNLNISGGTIKSVYGSGSLENAVVSGNTNITISSGTIEGIVYGGGVSCIVKGNSNISITGGTIMGNIYGGGNGSTANANVEKNANISITGGKILKNVYGGGRAEKSNVKGTRTITVGGSAEVGSAHTIYAYGIVLNSPTVTTGVDSFNIKDDLTSSVYISLQSEYQNKNLPKVIASDAVKGDLDKLVLGGNGFKNSELYFDSSDNTIKIKKSKFTVKFDSNDGSAIANSVVVNGVKLPKPIDPSKTGYSFEGWYKEETLENKWNFESDTVNDDISLYAKWIDDIAPDVKLSIETNEWKTFLNNMTFKLFFKETKSVIINASDEGSGVKSVQYLLSDQAFSSEGDITGTWQNLTLNDGEVSFDINPNNKYFIYAKVVDNDNNETVVNSDGIVLYTKSILKSEVAEFNFDKQEDILVEIELNGNTLKSISNSTTLLTENTDYTINDNVVTINKDYIANVLNGDEIELTFLYNPMGVEKDEVSVITTLKIAKHKHNLAADDGDCSTAIVCNECDVIMVDAKDHSWESNWQIDNNKHWHKCTNGGCIKSNEDGVHEWGDGEVTTPATVDNEGVKTYTCSLCEHTKTEVIPKIIPNETLVDTSSGIKVTYEDEREFESSIILTIKSEPQEKMNEFNDEVNKVVSGYSLCGLYDVKLLKDGIEIQPDGKIKISIPLVNIIKPMTDLQIIYIDDEGKVTIIPSEVKDGYLVFITDHLSYYGVIGKVNITIDNGGSTPSDKVDSGDNQLIQNYFMILIMSFGILMILKHQHQRELVEVESTRRIKGFKNKVKFTKFAVLEIIKEVKNKTYFK